MTVLGSDRAVRRFDGDSAELARAVLAHLPCDREQLLQHLTELGGPIEHPEVVDQLLDLLLAANVIREGSPAPAKPKPAGARILVGLTGAAATMHSPALVRSLQRRGHEVRIATTENALRFVTTDALTALTHEPVYTGMFDAPSIAPHIELAEWVDAVVISPATATTIARIAGGDCSDLVAAVAVSTRAPVIIAPSMNPAMLEAASVQRNLQTLREDGFFVVHPQLAEEVAHAPGERTGVLGGAADGESIAEILEIILAAHPVDWDAIYRTTTPGTLAWFEPDLDPDLAQILEREALPGSRLLDAGTGLGSVAAGAARMGFSVVATDVSPAALARARERAQDLEIIWLLDDITESRLQTVFDTVIDRACLHVLPEKRVAGYVDTIARVAGSLLLIKTCANEETPGTRAYSPEQIARLFSDRFQLRASIPSSIARLPATLFVLKRLP